MVFDLVFPQGNEEKLAQMARRLGFDELLCCYPMTDPLLKQRKAELDKLSDEALRCQFAILVKDQQQVSKAKNLTPNVVALSRREFFEDKRVRFVLGMERSGREDFVHHRNSGLTQVQLQAAIRSGITILIDFHPLLEKDPHVTLGRILQNNEFYRKYKVPTVVVSGAGAALEMRSPRDLANILSLRF